MELRSSDGRIFRLAVQRYQFSSQAAAERPGFDWDANWLVIDGLLILPDGRRFRFSDSCLTTDEAIQLAEWLENPASTPAGRKTDGDHDLDLVFTEPCIALALESETSDSVTLRIYLSLEAEPPWPIDGGTGTFENYVTFLISRSDLLRAVSDWREELRAFPVR
jgi:hypothetical protein